MTPDLDSFHRFIDAQSHVIDAVRAELAAGRKRTHWMWFVFPQLRSLGHSDTARHFGLTGLIDATAYLAHAELGPRLIHCTTLVLQHADRSANAIFGSPDDMKFHSCMTLFATAARASSTQAPFDQALASFFDAIPDPRTLDLLGA